MSCYTQWNDQTSLRSDVCARKQFDQESRGSGVYQLSNPAIRECLTSKQYAAKMCNPVHQQKMYRNVCNVDVDSKLRHAELTDKRFIDQLFTRPYLGSFMGAGTGPTDVTVESNLIHGHTTRAYTNRACDVLSGVSIDRFESLPEFGNPQRVQHIVEPWTRGGTHTRDMVRRVNYDARCANKKNNKLCIH